jgi:SAM-dependent methyltransferase
MAEAFYEDVSDGFGGMTVDVPALYERMPLGRREGVPPRSRYASLYSLPLVPLGLRLRAARTLRRLDVDPGWFHEFGEYWTGVLGGRPLWGVDDFHFLRGWYRLHSQRNRVPDTDDAQVHLEAWQRPELLYQLFHQVYVGARYPVAEILRLLRSEAGGRLASTLEFGCATAPVTTDVLEFLHPRPLEATICDLQTVAFHFGAWRHATNPNVHPLLLVPDDDFRLTLERPVDVVFCLTVFEHLNRPLETAQELADVLRPGGLLFFDYLKTSGGGLDTVHGARERERVLDFVGKRFDLVHGRLDPTRSTGLTVARKR